MPKVILVGVDDHDTARDAVALGASLAGAMSGELVLVHVYPYDPLAGSVALGAPPDAPLQREAEDIVERAAEGCPMPYRRVVMPHTSTVGGLHDEALRAGADLLVVGSNHRGAVGRVAFGSHSERVLHGAPCAVAVAPRGLAQRAWEPQSIAAGFDGSEDSAHAIAVARELGAATGAPVRLVTIVESAPGGWERYGYQPNWREHEHEMVKQAEQALAGVASGEETEVRIGGAVEQLLALSAQVDLLVLGSRGYGPVRRVMVGAAAHRVARDAQCPLVVVPRSAREPVAESEAVAEAGA